MHLKNLRLKFHQKNRDESESSRKSLHISQTRKTGKKKFSGSFVIGGSFLSPKMERGIQKVSVSSSFNQYGGKRYSQSPTVKSNLKNKYFSSTKNPNLSVSKLKSFKKSFDQQSTYNKKTHKLTMRI
jgi:hypothetical protein